MAGALHHDERITLEVLARHEPRFFAAARKTADADSAALAERIALEPAVPADHRAFLGLDRAGTARQPLAHELAEWPLPDGADSRRVALHGVWLPALARDGAEFALAPAQSTVALARTTAATLGIARTTGAEPPRTASIRAVGNPAAMET